LAVDEKVSLCGVLLCGVQGCSLCVQKHHYEVFRLLIIFLGPVSGVAQIRGAISPGRVSFCTMVTNICGFAEWNFRLANWRLEFLDDSKFFGGRGRLLEFLYLFRFDGFFAPKLVGKSPSQSLYMRI
jgi:hypothetical protein